MNKHFYRAVLRDCGNRVKFGKNAPCYGERIFVKSDDCHYHLPSVALKKHFHCRLREGSGLVVRSWPDTDQQPIHSHQKIRFCLAHWVDGVSWEDAGAIAYMMERIARAPQGEFDGCSSLQDVEERYRRLDKLFVSLKAGSPFLSVKQLMPENFREVGGVVFHLGPNGTPIFGGGGAHRLAMGMALGLTIPAQLGLVHRSALGRLPEYRKAPAQGQEDQAT